jgi:hypothetical protein
MNAYYHYKYSNELQFVSTANETIIRLKTDFGCEIPKCIGVWRFKKVNKKVTNKTKIQ